MASLNVSAVVDFFFCKIFLHLENLLCHRHIKIKVKNEGYEPSKFVES